MNESCIDNSRIGTFTLFGLHTVGVQIGIFYQSFNQFAIMLNACSDVVLFSKSLI